MLQPNSSLSWRATLWVLAGIAAVALTIASLFALAGAWLVLPFAGLELAALGLALHRCATRGCEREVISIEGDTVAIERGRFRPTQRHELPRSWTRVVLDRPGARGHPSRLLIRAHDRSVEVGAWLVEEERTWLAQELRHRLAA